MSLSSSLDSAEEELLAATLPPNTLPPVPPAHITIVPHRPSVARIAAAAAAARPEWYGVVIPDGFAPDLDGHPSLPPPPSADAAPTTLFIDDLPPELLLIVFGYLGLGGLYAARATCRTWRFWIESETAVWRRFVTTEATLVAALVDIHVPMAGQIASDLFTYHVAKLNNPWEAISYCICEGKRKDGIAHLAAARSKLKSVQRANAPMTASVRRSLVMQFRERVEVLGMVALAVVAVVSTMVMGALRIDGTWDVAWPYVFVPLTVCLFIGSFVVTTDRYWVGESGNRFVAFVLMQCGLSSSAAVVGCAVILAAARAEGWLSAPWAAVLVPTYVVMVLAGLVSTAGYWDAYNSCMSPRRGAYRVPVAAVFLVIFAVVGDASLAMLAIGTSLKLHKHVDWDWWAVLSPLIVFLSLGIVSLFWLAVIDYNRYGMGEDAVALTGGAAVIGIPVLVTTLLVAAVASDPGSVSGWAVFVPLWLPLLAVCAGAVSVAASARRKRRRLYAPVQRVLV